VTFRLVVASGGFQHFRAASKYNCASLVSSHSSCTFTFTRRQWTSEVLWTEVLSKCEPLQGEIVNFS
jgi:hypothetical protein